MPVVPCIPSTAAIQVIDGYPKVYAPVVSFATTGGGGAKPVIGSTIVRSKA